MRSVSVPFGGVHIAGANGGNPEKIKKGNLCVHLLNLAQANVIMRPSELTCASNGISLLGKQKGGGVEVGNLTERLHSVVGRRESA